MLSVINVTKGINIFIKQCKSKRNIFFSFNAVMQETVMQIIVSCLTDIDSVAESFKVEIMGSFPQ